MRVRPAHGALALALALALLTERAHAQCALTCGPWCLRELLPSECDGLSNADLVALGTVFNPATGSRDNGVRSGYGDATGCADPSHAIGDWCEMDYECVEGQTDGYELNNCGDAPAKPYDVYVVTALHVTCHAEQGIMYKTSLLDVFADPTKAQCGRMNTATFPKTAEPRA